MKTRSILLTFILLCIGFAANAQVFILNDNMFKGRMTEIKTTVLDSLSGEPVPFASVYVVPVKDTTITNFTLTDVKGEAKLEEVPFGNYVFHIEMMGYKPFIKEKFFRQEHDDMGTIRLQPDNQFLQAAVISDVANPIVVKKDTVEFNASSFRVGANAMLKDLIKRMPGMEITEDGKVKFNGEEIDKLTIGGKTFFFGDQSTALNNLPASVVDKIRVIDKDSEATRATGIEDGTKEKVLDVALKKEYQQGWFGNISLKGGAKAGKKDEETLRDNKGALYNANVLASAYSEKDQITFIANTQNVDESGMVFVLMTDDDDVISNYNQGLTNASQIGVNANTSRIKDVETTVSANYKYGDTKSALRSHRTTYQEGGDIMTSSDDTGRKYATSAGGMAEFQKEKGKVWFHIRPIFHYDKTENNGAGQSETYREGASKNFSQSAQHDMTEKKNTEFEGDITFRELWGKKDRTIRFYSNLMYSKKNGYSDEYSNLTIGDVSDSRTMHYDVDGNNRTLAVGVRYTEPFGKKWKLSVLADYHYVRRENTRNAFDQAGYNDYYSSLSRTNYKTQEYDLTMQYKFAEDSWITLGGRIMGINSETYSKSYGIEDVTGKGERDWFITPTIRFEHNHGINRYSAYVSGYSRRPSVAQMLPVMNISNPARPVIGNIYLKPGTRTYMNFDFRRNNREKFTNLMVYFWGNVEINTVTNALWYDASGVLYSVPVNAKKPEMTLSLISHYTFPLDSKKQWSFHIGGGTYFNYTTSYQTKGILPGLDKDNFDYSDFMKDFWGNASGDRFYSGKSGFTESRTTSFQPYFVADLKLNKEAYNIVLGATSRGYIARYSLDPKFNMKTFDNVVRLAASYTTKNEYEFESEIEYNFYNGYSDGFGKPEWIWNAGVSKNIGAFSLSLNVHDILNQTRNLDRTVNANYKEDTYRLVLGRYVLVGIKWNFGKMNATHSQRAQEAAWNMIY